MITVLSESTIGKIAAGEVVERPASIVKELIDNSIDAGADNITVTIHDSGKTTIIVKDNGIGMNKEDLLLCTKNHATSKINDSSDLITIKSLGFRGEALASIVAISEVVIKTKIKDSQYGWEITIKQDSASQAPKPCPMKQGTQIEVKNIFCYIPARLKFMKSSNVEQQRIKNVIDRFALLYHEKAFSLINRTGNLKSFIAQSQLERINSILPSAFLENACEVNCSTDNIKIQGFVSIPTFNFANGESQYIYVNNRFIKDKALLATIRSVYQNYLISGRYPAFVLFIEIPSNYVDINVHPAKTEVRFINEYKIKTAIIKAVSSALDSKSNKTSTQIGKEFIENISEEANDVSASYANEKKVYDTVQQHQSEYDKLSARNRFFSDREKYDNNIATKLDYNKEQVLAGSNHIQSVQVDDSEISKMLVESIDQDQKILEEKTINNSEAEQQHVSEKIIEKQNYLGYAKCQLHNTYIVSQVEDGFILVDQHAAHERLVKAENQKVIYDKQLLSIPVVVNMDIEKVAIIKEYWDKITKYNFEMRNFGESAIMLVAVPSYVRDLDLEVLFNRIADDLLNTSEPDYLVQITENILGNKACRNSIKAGQELSVTEMNAMLRKMEETPYSGQCNHGRPTYVKINLDDMEKLFERQ